MGKEDMASCCELCARGEESEWLTSWLTEVTGSSLIHAFAGLPVSGVPGGKGEEHAVSWASVTEPSCKVASIAGSEDERAAVLLAKSTAVAPSCRLRSAGWNRNAVNFCG